MNDLVLITSMICSTVVTLTVLVCMFFGGKR